MKNILIAAVLTAVTVIAHAGEAEVKKTVETKLGKIEKLAKTPVQGLWEAVVDGQVVYADDSGQYLMFGSLLDTKTGKNLTSDRQFSLLPLDLALKQVRGNGKGIMVTFEDPNCGYCKKLAKEIQKVDNVTVYTFLYPVLGDDSHEKSKAIWCTTDRMKAWNEWMINGKDVGKAPAKCDLAGLEKSIETGRRLRISGTPHIMFGGGDRVPGYLPAEELSKRLAAGS